MAQGVTNLASMHEDPWPCSVGSGSCIAVAVAQAGRCSSDSTPSLGTSYAPGSALKKKKKNAAPQL